MTSLVIQAEVESLCVAIDLEREPNDRVVILLVVAQHRGMFVGCEFLAGQDAIDDFPLSFGSFRNLRNFVIKIFDHSWRRRLGQQQVHGRVLFRERGRCQ